MRDYVDSTFPRQLRTLRYETTPRHIAEIFHLNRAQFFGGKDWERAREDLSGILEPDRVCFILSLFMFIVTDQALFTYSTNTYDEWNAEKRFPKFGWFGFGVHNENPLKLLWIPEKEELIDTAALIAALPEFIDFFIAESKRMVVERGHSPSLDIHFANIRHDPAWTFNKGSVIPAFKAELDKQLGDLR